MAHRKPFNPGAAKGGLPAESLFAASEHRSAGTETHSEPPQQTRAKQANRSGDAPLTITAVGKLINDALAVEMPRQIRAIGEVSNLTRRGHWYFSLKDEQSVLKCVAWASKARSFHYEPENGASVIATGSIQFYGPQGQTQMYIEQLEPVGIGVLELRFRELCDELRTLGYFNPETKKALPLFPRRVAVVTSAKSAAVQDVITTAARRCPGVDILVVDVLVQGTGAAPMIAQSLKDLGRRAPALGIDAVILTRGGGSMEDLWAFNERIVAEAIHTFPIPIIAAIGHETDTTIAELVADLRCATPTQAAVAVIPDRQEWLGRLGQYARRMQILIRNLMHSRSQRLQSDTARLGGPEDVVLDAGKTVEQITESLRRVMAIHLSRLRTDWQEASATLNHLRPERLASQQRARIDRADFRLMAAWRARFMRGSAYTAACANNLTTALKAHVAESQTVLAHASAELRGLSPAGVLRRGYSITRRASDGAVLRSVHEAATGEVIETALGDGSVVSEVRSQSERASAEDRMTASGPSLPPREQRRRTIRGSASPGKATTQ